MADQEVQGLDGVLAALNALEPAIRKKILNGAMRVGANLIAKEAVSRAIALRKPDPYRTVGLIKKMIAVRKRKRIPSGCVTGYAVGVLGGAALAEKSTRKTRKKGVVNNQVDLRTRPAYWRFIEFGTQNAPAQPFLRPAFETQGNAAIDAIAKALQDRLPIALQAAISGQTG